MNKAQVFGVILSLFLASLITIQGCSAQQEVRTTNDNDFVVLAHRGVHQDFSKENLDNKACTAKQMLKPEHPYLENTIESIEKAFEFGATVVEMDVYNQESA